MENRRFQRMVVDGLQAVISDGGGFYTGELIDISQDGVLMADLPQGFGDDAEKMKLVIYGMGCRFIMMVRPRWTALNGKSLTIGFKIIDNPWEWTEFIMGALADTGAEFPESGMLN